MRGIAIVDGDGRPDPAKAKELSASCFARGLNILVCGIHGNIIRVLMPLTIEQDLLQKGLDIMEAGLAEI